MLWFLDWVLNKVVGAINTLLQILSNIFFGASIILLSVAALYMILAAGDPRKYEASKERILQIAIATFIFYGLTRIIVYILTQLGVI